MNHEARVKRLEQRIVGDDQGPMYIAVERMADLDGLQLERPVKVYVGVSPDDWPAARCGNSRDYRNK